MALINIIDESWMNNEFKTLKQILRYYSQFLHMLSNYWGNLKDVDACWGIWTICDHAVELKVFRFYNINS